MRFVRGASTAELAFDGSNPPVHALVQLPRASTKFELPTWMTTAGVRVQQGGAFPGR